MHHHVRSRSTEPFTRYSFDSAGTDLVSKHVVVRAQRILQAQQVLLLFLCSGCLAPAASLRVNAEDSLGWQRAATRQLQANWTTQGAVLWSVNAMSAVPNDTVGPLQFKFVVHGPPSAWLTLDRSANGTFGLPAPTAPPVGLVFNDLLAVELSLSDALEAVRAKGLSIDLFFCYLCQPLTPAVTHALYFFTTSSDHGACTSTQPHTYAIVDAVSGNVTQLPSSSAALF
uniref:Uncharacterized protein n=1 Tax=Haptolina brevifila TaxID=156173 RepID=A0A7S2CMC2_9EUKA|mmetsp:Transcript_26708/g.53655  ORF Transcript_26708/g.53655 Transcript_26708/m.53655 type:complete len:228 (+) Transcript_26708:275-958(+)